MLSSVYVLKSKESALNGLTAVQTKRYKDNNKEYISCEDFPSNIVFHYKSIKRLIGSVPLFNTTAAPMACLLKFLA